MENGRSVRWMAIAVIWIGSMGATAIAAPAATLRLCTFDHPFPPYTMPDGSGQTQELLRRAAIAVHLNIENLTAPRQRCLEFLQTGRADALVAAFAPDRLKFGVYPTHHGAVDRSKALATPRFLVYRRRGDTVTWDGRHFSGLQDRTVGIQFGFSLVTELRAAGVAVDDAAETTEQNLGKLALQRVAAVIALDSDANPLIAREYSGQIEALPIAFETTPLFLLVSRDFAAKHPTLVEDYWTAIRTTREGQGDVSDHR